MFQVQVQSILTLLFWMCSRPDLEKPKSDALLSTQVKLWFTWHWRGCTWPQLVARLKSVEPPIPTFSLS